MFGKSPKFPNLQLSTFNHQLQHLDYRRLNYGKRIPAAYRNLSIHQIDVECIAGLPEVGDGQLHFFVDCSLEKTRSISRTEAFLDEHVYCAVGNDQLLALLLHLLRYLVDI